MKPRSILLVAAVVLLIGGALAWFYAHNVLSFTSLEKEEVKAIHPTNSIPESVPQADSLSGLRPEEIKAGSGHLTDSNFSEAIIHDTVGGISGLAGKLHQWPKESFDWKQNGTVLIDAIPTQKRPAPTGKVVFNWPSRMKVGETYQTHLAIAGNVTLQELTAQVDSLVVVDDDTAGQHRRQHIKLHVQLGRHMKAALMGASLSDPNVTISLPPGDDGNRTIDLQTDTSVVWSWNVTPHKTGPLRLTMFLSPAENNSRPVDVRTILVQGEEPNLIDQISGFLTTLNGFWVVVSTGFLGKLANVIWNWWKARKKAPTGQPSVTNEPGS